jgi:hypothetical protein
MPKFSHMVGTSRMHATTRKKAREWWARNGITNCVQCNVRFCKREPVAAHVWRYSFWPLNPIVATPALLPTCFACNCVHNAKSKNGQSFSAPETCVFQFKFQTWDKSQKLDWFELRSWRSQRPVGKSWLSSFCLCIV